MPYRVLIPHHAKKQLRDIPREFASRILDALEGFAQDLDYARWDVRKVRDSPKHQPRYRLRSGDYRVTLLIAHTTLIIEVISVRRRKGNLEY
jgi:mRNA-degrading endonuclease RelE of RelBE toxin-antitoxin system